jgi:hypothetical protein
MRPRITKSKSPPNGPSHPNGYGALFDSAAFISIGLDELNVLARTRSSDLDVHTITINAIKNLSIMAI